MVKHIIYSELGSQSLNCFKKSASLLFGMLENNIFAARLDSTLSESSHSCSKAAKKENYNKDKKELKGYSNS